MPEPKLPMGKQVPEVRQVGAGPNRREARVSLRKLRSKVDYGGSSSEGTRRQAFGTRQNNFV
jgi:hypothetical protein